jgi:transketolase
MRKQFTISVQKLLADDDRIVLLLGDIGVHAFRDSFKRHPDRCYNLGTAEQTMVGMAAGLAKEGFYPIVHSIAPFLVRRAYEQIYIDFGAQELPGLFVTVGADNDYPTLGPTHRCPEDLKLMAEVPGMMVFAPQDVEEVNAAICTSVTWNDLGYVRLRKLTSDSPSS